MQNKFFKMKMSLLDNKYIVIMSTKFVSC